MPILLFWNLIRTINCNITLITRDNDRLSNIEIEKYNRLIILLYLKITPSKK